MAEAQMRVFPIVATALLLIAGEARGQATVGLSSLPTPASPLGTGTLFLCQSTSGQTEACTLAQILAPVPQTDASGGLDLPIGAVTPAPGTFTNVTIDGMLTFGPGGSLDVMNTPITVNGVATTLGAELGALSLSISTPSALQLLATGALPLPCNPGTPAYAVDGRKTGEAAGAGSGTPVMCTLAAKGGATVWWSTFTNAPVTQ